MSTRQFTIEQLAQYLRDSSAISSEESRQVCLQASRELIDHSDRIKMLEVERDESEARAVSLMQFVPGDVRVAQIQSLRDAYKAWREWFSAAPAGEIKFDSDRLIAVGVAPMNRGRSVLNIHFNRSMSSDEMKRLHEHLLRFGTRIQGPFRVVTDKDPCKCCEQGGMYTVVVFENGEEVAIGTSWADEEYAQDICDLMNMAYDLRGDVEDQNAEQDGA